MSLIENENKGFMQRNELLIVFSMFGAAGTALLLGMMMPASGNLLGMNVTYGSRFITFAGGVLLGEAMFIYAIIRRRMKSS